MLFSRSHQSAVVGLYSGGGSVLDKTKTGSARTTVGSTHTLVWLAVYLLDVDFPGYAVMHPAVIDLHR